MQYILRSAILIPEHTIRAVGVHQKNKRKIRETGTPRETLDNTMMNNIYNYPAGDDVKTSVYRVSVQQPLYGLYRKRVGTYTHVCARHDDRCPDDSSSGDASSPKT